MIKKTNNKKSNNLFDYNSLKNTNNKISAQVCLKKEGTYTLISNNIASDNQQLISKDDKLELLDITYLKDNYIEKVKTYKYGILITYKLENNVLLNKRKSKSKNKNKFEEKEILPFQEYKFNKKFKYFKFKFIDNFIKKSGSNESYYIKLKLLNQSGKKNIILKKNLSSNVNIYNNSNDIFSHNIDESQFINNNYNNDTSQCIVKEFKNNYNKNKLYSHNSFNTFDYNDKDIINNSESKIFIITKIKHYNDNKASVIIDKNNDNNYVGNKIYDDYKTDNNSFLKFNSNIDNNNNNTKNNKTDLNKFKKINNKNEYNNEIIVDLKLKDDLDYSIHSNKSSKCSYDLVKRYINNFSTNNMTNSNQKAVIKKNIDLTKKLLKNSDYNKILYTTSNLDSNYSNKCPICLESYIKKSLINPCKHTFCFKCISKWSTINTICPICDKYFNCINAIDESLKKNVKIKERKFSNFYDDEGYSECNTKWYNSLLDHCYVCKQKDNEYLMLVCDKCNYNVCHYYCDGLDIIPYGKWFCYKCR